MTGKLSVYKNKKFLVIKYLLRFMSYFFYFVSFFFACFFITIKLFENRFSEFTFINDTLHQHPFLFNILVQIYIFLGSMVTAYFVRLMSNLVDNIARDIIFENANVKYLKRLALLAFLLAFYSNDFWHRGLSIEVIPLLLALSLYISSIILKRAIVIVKEQELTI